MKSRSALPGTLQRMAGAMPKTPGTTRSFMHSNQEVFLAVDGPYVLRAWNGGPVEACAAISHWGSQSKFSPKSNADGSACCLSPGEIAGAFVYIFQTQPHLLTSQPGREGNASLKGIPVSVVLNICSAIMNYEDVDGTTETWFSRIGGSKSSGTFYASGEALVKNILCGVRTHESSSSKKGYSGSLEAKTSLTSILMRIRSVLWAVLGGQGQWWSSSSSPLALARPAMAMTDATMDPSPRDGGFATACPMVVGAHDLNSVMQVWNGDKDGGFGSPRFDLLTCTSSGGNGFATVSEPDLDPDPTCDDWMELDGGGERS